MQWQCRIASSLGGGFAGTPNEVWGTKDYTRNDGRAVFFGMYGLRDLGVLWKHEDRKAILWAGTDILHFVNGYFWDDVGKIRITPETFSLWLNENCENWVENGVEAEALLTVGIDAKICPSFLGNIDDYEVSYKPNGKYYTSVSGDNFEQYGWHEIPGLAEAHPDLEFHLYGNAMPWSCPQSNVIVHGRVSQEEMNEEIKEMTGAFRLTRHDGFSEILAKSILWGQHPVSPHIPYPHIAEEFAIEQEPNLEGRDYYREHVNKFPWNDLAK